MSGISGTLKVVSLVLWALTIAWLPLLVAAEVLRPRPRYNVRRWSTVFPVGMYAACSFVVGAVATAPAITDFARVWVWAGVGVWLVVFLAMLRRGQQLARGEHPSLSTGRLEAPVQPATHHALVQVQIGARGAQAADRRSVLGTAAFDGLSGTRAEVDDAPSFAHLGDPPEERRRAPSARRRAICCPPALVHGQPATHYARAP